MTGMPYVVMAYVVMALETCTVCHACHRSTPPRPCPHRVVGARHVIRQRVGCGGTSLSTIELWPKELWPKYLLLWRDEPVDDIAMAYIVMAYLIMVLVGRARRRYSYGLSGYGHNAYGLSGTSLSRICLYGLHSYGRGGSSLSTI